MGVKLTRDYSSRLIKTSFITNPMKHILSASREAQKVKSSKINTSITGNCTSFESALGLTRARMLGWECPSPHLFYHRFFPPGQNFTRSLRGRKKKSPYKKKIRKAFLVGKPGIYFGLEEGKKCDWLLRLRASVMDVFRWAVKRFFPSLIFKARGTEIADFLSILNSKSSSLDYFPRVKTVWQMSC